MNARNRRRPFRPHAQRSLAASLVALLIFGVLAIVPLDHAAAARAFALRFDDTVTGDIIMASNTLMTCRPAANNCADAQSGASGTAYHNGSFGTLQRVDIDPFVHTHNNSSSATLTVPPSGNVLFAGLYWGAYSNAADRGSVEFGVPGAGYVTINDPDGVDNLGAPYSGFADVTALVQAAGNGVYTVADVASEVYGGAHAGWSLVVAFEDPNEPFRNLTVFDGLERVNPNTPIDINVSGFIAPPTGPVTASIGFVTYEGDNGIAGDYAELNGIRLGDAANPQTNFFNSTISDSGVVTPGRTPSYADQFGFDATVTDTVGVVPPGATSATVALRSAGDWYYPAVVTAAIDVYVPNLVLDLDKTVVDNNGGATVPGDILTYEISFSNQGDDPALQTVLSDVIPTGSTYVAGSGTIISGDNPGPANVSYSPASNTLTAYLGVGATPTAGGRIVPFTQSGTTYTMQFQVTVDQGTEGTTIDNVGTLDYIAETIGDAFSANTNEVSNPVVSSADYGLSSKTDDVDPVVAGGSLNYTIEAFNNGPSAAAGTTITDYLPAGFSFSAAGSDPRCGLSGQLVVCTIGTMAAGSTDSVTIAVNVDPTTDATSFRNKATINSTTGDSNPNDNTVAEITEVVRLVDMTTTKAATPNPVIPVDDALAGGQVSYEVTITNNGPSTATNPVLVDQLPAGVSVVSVSDPACSTTPGVVSCSWPTLAVGATNTITIVVDVPPSAADGSVLKNSVKVGSDDPEDPTGEPNSATVANEVARRADLATTKTAQGPAIAGEPLLYDVVVENLGESHATNVSITDALPAGTTFLPALSSSACALSAGDVVCSLAQIDAGSSASFTIAIDIAASTADGAVLTNKATATADEDDPNPANNTDDDVSTVDREADLALTKSATPDPVSGGTNVTYTLEVTNSGPSDASGVTITDPLPAGLTLVSAPGCSGTTTLTCVIGALADGATTTITIVAAVSPTITDGTALVNTANVAGNETDPDPADNTSTATVTAERKTKLEITKSESAGFADPAAAGSQISWDIVVTNEGPATDDNVTLVDDLSTFPLSNIAVTGTGCSIANAVLTCALGTMAPNQVETITITADIDADAPDGTIMTNEATVDGDFSDPAVGTEETTIDLLADLELTKVGPTEIIAGENATWTVSVVNNGPGQANDVEILDILPVEANFVSATVVSGTATCTSSGGTVNCAGSSLAPGATLTVEIVGLIARTEADGSTISNAAAVTTTTDDPDPSNDEDTVESDIVREADLAVTKASVATPVPAGEQAVYALTVTNAGPSIATNVVATDTFPAGFVFVPGLSDPACSLTGPTTVSCALGTVDPLNPPVSFSITFDVPSTYVTGTQTNTVSVSGAETDPNASNDNGAADVEIINEADISVVKTSPATAPIPGDSYTYTVVVSNDGPSTAANVELADLLPSGTTLAAGSDSRCTEAPAGSLTCPLGDMAPDAVETLTIVVDIDPSVTGDVVNTTTVTSDTPDPQPANDTSSDTSTAAPTADLELAKSAPATAIAGQSLSWTLDVSNAGPSDATNVVITDTLPAGVTWNAASDPRCSHSAGIVTCSLATVAAGGTDQVVLVVDMPASAVAGTTITNTASVDSDAIDPDLSNNEDTATSTVDRLADIAVTKTALAATAVAGGTVGFEIVVTNAGPSDATAIQVTDTLPAELTPVSADGATCSIAGQTVSCGLALLAPGASATITIVAEVDPSAPVGNSITNTASATAAETDPQPTNDSGSDTISTTRAADLAVTKTLLTTTPVAGEPLLWEVTVTNNGPSDASGVAIADPLPSGTTFDAAGSDPRCSTAATTIDCTIGVVASGASETVQLSLDTDSAIAAGALVTNVATAAANEDDPDPTNDTGSATATMTRAADLSTTKRAPDPDPVPGEVAIWEIDVTNNGSSDASNVVVTDQLPANVTFSAAATSPECAAAAAGAVDCSLATLAAGATVTFAIAALVGSDQLGDLTNNATVTADEPDPDDTNDDSTATVTVDPQADLEVAKIPLTDPVIAGEAVEWQITVTNNGPSDATDVVVNDIYPSALTYDDAASDSRCDDAGITVECDLGTVPAGTAVVFTVTFDVDSGVAPGSTITNTAQATSSTADPDPSNNTASASAPIETEADLAVVKTGPDNAVAGTQGTYEITVTNNGPSNALNVTLGDALPAGSTLASHSGIPGCATTSTTVDCTLATLASGDSATLTIVVDFDPSIAAGTTVTNTATASSDTPDPDPTNDSDTADTEIDRSADIAAIKTLTTSPIVAGEPVVWELVVTNNGPSDASALSAADTLPSGTAFRPDLSSAECATGVTCSIPTLAAGASVTLLIGVDTDASLVAGATLDNAATATAAEPDPDTTNNDPTTSDPITRSADLALAKTPLASPVIAGELATYEIVVVNNGPSDATDVVIADSLPPELTPQTVTGGACSIAGQYVSCDVPTLAPGASITIIVEALVGADQAISTNLSNTATVEANEDDPHATNDAATATIAVDRAADLATTKTLLTAAPIAGEPVSWEITVTNNGPSDASGVVVSDPLPSGATFVAASSDSRCLLVGAAVDCTVGTMALGSSETLVITMLLDPTIADGATVINVAAASGNEDDPDATNDSGTATATVARTADLSTVKRAPTPTPAPGQTVVWEIDVTNDGSSDASNVVVTDLLPANVTYVAAGSTSTCNEVATGTVECALPVVAAGDTITIEIAGQIGSDQLDDLTNEATVTADEPDPDPTNDDSTATTPVEPKADLSVAKTSPTSPVIAGQPMVWEVTVTNNGPSDAANVVVTDLYPSSLTYDDGASDPACNPSGANVACSTPLIVAGTSTTFQLTFDVASSLLDGAAIANTAQVTSDTPDPDPTNNTDTEAIDVNSEADIAVVKTGPLAAVAGTQGTYEITISNAGPSDAVNVVLTDALPAGTTLVSHSGITGCTDTASAVTCSIGSLAAGASLTLSITVEFSSTISDGSTVTNSASATTDTTDSDLSNNGDSTDTSVVREANLEAVKTTTTSPLVAGEPALWSITITNNGPSAATGVTVADTLPSGASFRNDLSTPGCTSAVSCPVGSLPVGASATVTVGADLDPALLSGALLDNAAVVSANETDPDPSDNNPTTSDPVTRSADLSIVKAGPADPIAAGGAPFTWTLSVQNAGPSAATNVVITDTLPAGVTMTAASDPRCTVAGQVVTCSIGAMAEGSFDAVDLVVTTDPSIADGTQLENSASVAADEPDPDPGDNGSIHVVDSERTAGLTITKVDLADPVVAGESVTWEVEVTNLGPSTVDNVVVTDTMPVGATFAAGGSNAECTETSGVVSCAAGTMLPNTSVIFIIEADLDSTLADGDQIVNSATASGDLADSATTTEESTIQREADISITKTASASPIVPGEPLTYTIVVSNAGPSQATDVEVIDVLPVGATVLAVRSGGTCTENAGSVMCNLGNIDTGLTETIEIDILPAAYLDDGIAFLNSAVVTAAEDDPNPVGNTGVSEEPVDRRVDVSITKAVSNTVVSAGEAVTFELVVANAGPSDDGNVTIVDSLPPGVTFDALLSSSSCVESSPGTITCSVGSLAAGDETSVTVGVTVNEATPSGELVNQATVETAEENSATDTTAAVPFDVNEIADLSIVKTGPAVITPGTTASYTIEVTNFGPSFARNVVITDPLPSGVAFVSASPSCVLTGTDLECAVGDLALGESTSVELTVDVDDDVVQPVMNSATAASDATDPDGTSNSSSTIAELDRIADLSIDKDLTTERVLAGGSAHWLLTVTNAGPSTATGVNVVDVLPQGFTFSNASGAECAAVGSTVTCESPDELLVGASVSFVLVADVATTMKGDTENTATAAANETDPDGATAEEPMTITRADAELAITKENRKSDLDADGISEWEIVATNNGPDDVITTLTLTDPLPAALDYVSSSASAGTVCTETNNLLTCETQGLAVGDQIVVTVVTRTIDRLDEVTNTATVSADALEGGAGQSSSIKAAASSVVTRPESPFRPLAFSGANSLVLVSFALLLLLLGSVLALGTRRRRQG